MLSFSQLPDQALEEIALRLSPRSRRTAASACKGLRRGTCLVSSARAHATSSLGCSWGRETCACAAALGDLETLRRVRSLGCQLECCTWRAAAGNGHLHVLQWLKDTGCPGLDHSACTAAARGGHLAALQWLVEVCRCEMSYPVCSAAAAGGHLTLLEWALRHGCPCDRRAAVINTIVDEDSSMSVTCTMRALLMWAVGDEGISLAGSACSELVACGEQDLLRSLLDRSLLVRSDSGIVSDSAVIHAAEHGHVEAEPTEDWMSKLYTSAAKHGHVAVLEWLSEEFGVTFDDWSDKGSELCCSAAASGHVAVLQWASQHGCAACLEEDVCKAAALHGRNNALQWLVDAEQHGGKRAALTSRVSLAATQGGHLEVLQLLRRHGCEWTDATPYKAAKQGNLELLQCVVSEGCEWRPLEAKAAALSEGWADVVGWINKYLHV
eukprot:jgi/Tetstr1/437710/TSEL_026365.t1